MNDNKSDPLASDQTTGPDYIVEALWPLAVRVDSVRPSTDNPRQGDVSAVAKSLHRFRQRKPIVATADGTITAGHHMHAAAVTLGWDQIAVVFVDDDPIEARAFALADNRTSDLGRYDNELLAASLVKVRDADEELLVAASFTSEYVDDLLSYLEGPPPDYDDGEPPPDDDPGPEPEPKRCPNCGFDLSD